MRYLFLPSLLVFSNVLLAQANRLVVAEIKGNDTTYAEVPQVVDGHGIHYHYVEHMPEPVVDIDSFITRNLHYPVDAKAKRKQGRVMVAFIINDKGDVINVHIAKPVYPSLSAEAIRVIASMPAWKPANEKGKNISVEFSLPVVFKL